MNGIRATASILTTIQLGIKSAQGIRDVLSAVKEGPKMVAQLAQDVESLSVVLGRLEQCPLNASSPLTVASLKTYLAACNKQLSDTRYLLESLKVISSSRVDRLRAGFRTARKDKDLEQAGNRIRDCGLQLNVYLGLLQMEATASHGDGTSGIFQQILSEIGKLHHRMDSSDTSAAAEESPTSRANATSGVVEPEVMEACSDLQESISRLSNLVTHQESTLDKDDAAQIIDDLQRLIQSATDQVCRSQCADDRCTGQQKNRSLRNDMRQIQGLIYGAPVLAINRTVKSSRLILANMPKGTMIKQKRLREDIDLGCGVLTVTANKRRRFTKRNIPESSLENGESYNDIVATFLFKPTNHASTIAISVTQGQLIDRSIQSIPRISINPIISKDSIVFKVVKQGRIEEFRAMLAAGEANVRVHDQDGRGLLHYALEWPKICRILIDAGVDVDEIGDDLTPLGLSLLHGYNETLQLLLQNAADPSLNTPGRTDPLMRACDNANSFALESFRNYSYPFLQSRIDEVDGTGSTMLDCVCAAFVDADCNRRALEILIDAGADIRARTTQGHPSVAIFSGYTCLHSLVSHAHLPSTKDELESLVFLIRKGASIRAVDDHYQSVSTRAYTKNIMDSRKLGCYRADLWDAALVTCGYGLLEFRKDYPRVARYGGEYCRADFERLWEGIEHCCPYWDDCRWPSTGGDSDYWITPDSSDLSDESDSEEADEELGSDYHSESEDGFGLGDTSGVSGTEIIAAESQVVIDHGLHGPPGTEESGRPDWLGDNGQLEHEGMDEFAPFRPTTAYGANSDMWMNVVLEDPWENIWRNP